MAVVRGDVTATGDERHKVSLWVLQLRLAICACRIPRPARSPSRREDSSVGLRIPIVTLALPSEELHLPEANYFRDALSARHDCF